MTDPIFTTYNLLARKIDTNRDGIINELQIDKNVKDLIDENNDGNVDVNELGKALYTDKAEVMNGRVQTGKGFDIHTNNLDVLRNMNSISANGKNYAYVPSYFNLEGEERDDAVRQGNSNLASAISGMRRTMEDILDISRNNSDSISKNVFTIAKNTLNSTSGNFLSGFSSSTWTQSSLESDYNELRNAFDNIKNITDNLPDTKYTLNAVNLSISQAFSNINEIKNSNQKPVEVKEKMYKLSKQQSDQISGRALSWGIKGAGMGAIVGGGIGYAIGKDMKTVIKVAAIGTAVTSLAGATWGYFIDKSYEKKSNELKQLGDDVLKYNPESEKGKLLDESLNTYEVMLNARGKHDIDNGIVITNNLVSIYDKVSPVEYNSQRIVNAYRAKTDK